MRLRIRHVSLWRAEVDDEPGALARILEPLATLKADLKVVMGYRLPGKSARAAIEVCPIAGKRIVSAAKSVGLQEASINAILVEAENRVGLGHAIAHHLAAARINLEFFVAQVSDDRYSTVIGLENAQDIRRATRLIRQAASAHRPAVAGTTPRTRAARSRRPRTPRRRSSRAR